MHNILAMHTSNSSLGYIVRFVKRPFQKKSSLNGKKPFQKKTFRCILPQQHRMLLSEFFFTPEVSHQYW